MRRTLSAVTVLLGLALVPPSALADQAPAHLERQMIEAAVAAIKPALTACGKRHPATRGDLRLAAVVSPAGRVTSVKKRAVKLASDLPLDLETCVVAAVKTMRFPLTRDGGSFTYPYRFPMP